MHRLPRLLVLLAAAALACGEMVVVLPFFNLSDSSSLDWIGESLAETVRETLAAEGVLALDREGRDEAFRRLAVRRYTQLTKASVIKIGEAVDAGRIVYGSFQVSPADGESSPWKASLEITAQVLDRRGMKQSPSFTESGALEDLASLQDRLAWQALRYLEPQMASPKQRLMGQRLPLRLDALENYVRGLLASTADQKHRYFTQAARLEENFSQPCFQLGKLHWRRKNYRVAAGWLERVAPNDAHYREATFLLGLCRYHLADYEGARASFELVARSVPLHEVWNNLGAVQSRLNLPQALDSFRKALQSDADDPVYRFNLGYALWRNGEYDEAAEMFRAVLDRNPEDSVAMTMLGRCLKRSGPRRVETTVEALERLKQAYQEIAYRRRQAQLASQATGPKERQQQLQ